MPGSTLSQSTDQRLEISGFMLEKTVKMMKLSFSRMLLLHPDVEITVDQWVIMHMLFRHLSLSQQEISDLTFKDAPTITRMIDLLVAKNLVQRNADKKDRRKYIIRLTEEGINKYKIIEPIVREFRSEAYNGISTDELKLMSQTLDKIFYNLSKLN
jgi:DNA-binding MarR family transcriptional regulator